MERSKCGLKFCKTVHSAKYRPYRCGIHCVPCIHWKDGRQVSFSSLLTKLLLEFRALLPLCTRMFPRFSCALLYFLGLGKDQRSRGNKWFPMHIEFPLILIFPLSLEIQYWQDSCTSP